MITVSIVSHGHGSMVERLVSQLGSLPDVQKIVVTLNIPEQLAFSGSENIALVRNTSPRGFGANHNAAFQECETDFFCVLNPDVVLLEDPFPTLLAAIKRHKAAVIAPLVVTSTGKIEDSVRRFPRLMPLLGKFAGFPGRDYVIEVGGHDFEPDWVAGMFMLFPAAVFQSLQGFDEAFFLYYEDVDICARTWKRGGKVVYCPSAKIIHDAQRASHKSWRFRRWHLQSLLRYLTRYTFRPPR